MRIISLLVLLFFQLQLFAEIKPDIKIRLFASYTGNDAFISPVDGVYYLLSQDFRGNTIDTIAVINADNNRSQLKVKRKDKALFLKLNNKFLGRHNSVLLKARDEKSTFLISYAGQKQRLYDGSLHISSNSSALQLINNVSLESYVAGVVESEVGSSGNKEFYKVQAILARTYAIKNYNKFIKNGYNLTDDVRSQVYHSKAYFVKREMIYKAVEETKNLVVVDSKNMLIDAAFHANSGGQTQNSGSVWVETLPYLKGVTDPFSLETEHDSLYWTKTFDKGEFLNFFYKAAPAYAHNNDFEKAILNFTQKNRKSDLTFKDVKIRLREIREAFSLKSTYFNIESKGNKVIVNGRGHGHGVGLSQVGAFNMAKNGFSFLEIIQYYYADVDVVDYSKVKFES